MRLLINITKIIAVSVVLIVVIYIIFSSQLSAFWYNRYETSFSVEFFKVLRDSSSVEEMISRRQQISSALPLNFNDLTWLKNEVLGKLSSEKTAMDMVGKIVRQQSRIPLLEPRLVAYHRKKLAWVAAQKKSLELFTDVKNTEYRVYELLNKLDAAQQMTKPPLNMDMNTWKENSIKGGTTAQALLEEIQNATEDKILIPEYEKSLVTEAHRIDALAQLNLKAIFGEITWDSYLLKLRELNTLYPQESLESALRLAEKWRTAIIDPKNEARAEVYDQAGTTLQAMLGSVKNAPILSDSITSFFVKRGWLSMPRLISDEPKTATLLASEIEQIKRMLIDPDVLFFRKALNSYINEDTSACITNNARKKIQNDLKLAGLDLFDSAYYKSKFIPITTGSQKTKENYVRVIFIDKPDRVFTGYISLSGNKRCLEALVTDDEENKTGVPELVSKYKKYIFDPQYTL